MEKVGDRGQEKGFTGVRKGVVAVWIHPTHYRELEEKFPAGREFHREIGLGQGKYYLITMTAQGLRV